MNSDDLDDRTRMTSILATLVGAQCVNEYKAMMKAAMKLGVTPVEIKEVVYQAVAYLGIGRVFDFLHATNDVLMMYLQSSKSLSLWRDRQQQLQKTGWRWELRHR